VALSHTADWICVRISHWIESGRDGRVLNFEREVDIEPVVESQSSHLRKKNMDAQEIVKPYATGHRDFSHTSLVQICLINAQAFDAQLMVAELTGSSRSDYDRSSPQLNPANLAHAEIIQAELVQVCHTHADLSGADLSGTDLAYANLSGANLSGAKFGGANLRHANLRQTDLTDVDLRKLNSIGGWKFRHRCRDVRITLARLMISMKPEPRGPVTSKIWKEREPEILSYW
jgi:uncharacterized protein YjbI with pentapeptide repeats